MIPVYLDTSCAVRLFLTERQEKGCDKQNERLRELKDVAFVASSLLLLEWQSAFRSKARKGDIPQGDFEVLQAAWADFSLRRIRFSPLDDTVIQAATDLLRTSKASGRIRSLDCIHFTTFLEIKLVYPEAILFSADSGMCELAREAKAPYFNPLEC